MGLWLVMADRDRKGAEVIGFSEHTRDVSQLMRADEALREAHDRLGRAHEELEHHVEARTSELRRANAALREEIEQRRRLEERLRQTEKMDAAGARARPRVQPPREAGRATRPGPASRPRQLPATHTSPIERPPSRKVASADRCFEAAFFGG